MYHGAERLENVPFSVFVLDASFRRLGQSAARWVSELHHKPLSGTVAEDSFIEFKAVKVVACLYLPEIGLKGGGGLPPW